MSFHAKQKGNAVLFVKAFGVWLILLVAAFVNGAIREMLIVPRVGEQVGHISGVVVFSAAIFGITYAFVKAIGQVPYPSR